MKIFLDTSSLFKLYHRETDTADLELVFSTIKITNIFLSEISKIEFSYQQKYLTANIASRFTIL